MSNVIIEEFDLDTNSDIPKKMSDYVFDIERLEKCKSCNLDVITLATNEYKIFSEYFDIENTFQKSMYAFIKSIINDF